jgi:hypothetical protein
LQQHTDVPSMQMLQSQPALMQAQTQLLQASIRLQQFLSPLQQVKQTPFWTAVHSHSHTHRSHWQTTLPFCVQQKLILPPDRTLHDSCSVAACCSLLQVQMNFTPPLHFSTFIVQQGTLLLTGLHFWVLFVSQIALDISTLPYWLICSALPISFFIAPPVT